MTREEALAAVQNAAWDADNSTLSGSEIWGVHGEFATACATRHFTYELAVKTVRDYYRLEPK